MPQSEWWRTVGRKQRGPEAGAAMPSSPALTAECAGAAARRCGLSVQRALARQRSQCGPSVPVNWVRAREVGALGGGDPGPQAADPRLPVGSLVCSVMGGVGMKPNQPFCPRLL